MPFQQRFAPDAAMLYEHWTGEPDRREVFEALAGHVEHPEFESIRWILSDERSVTRFDFGPHDLKDMARTAAEARRLYRGKRWALVIDEARATALALLFRQLLEQDVEVQIFSSIDAATTWLELTPQAQDYLDTCLADIPGERR